jgi:superfamily II DNA helicase RecQ
MPFEFVKVSVSGQGGGKEALNRLLKGGRIASLRKEFVAQGEDSFWAFCVEYLEGGEGGGGIGGERRGGGPKVDYREVLAEAEFVIFSRLRNLRKAIADKEAVPAYSIFTNEQLAAMVTGKVDSISGMEAIPGIGAARVGKYGEAFLALLKSAKGGGA